MANLEEPTTPLHPESMQAETDFDRSEPQAGLIYLLGAISLIGVLFMMVGVQAYYNHVREEAEYNQVLSPVADDLKSLHSQEDEELHTYKYVDRTRGVVQIPISRAMQLIAEEAAAKKLKYFQKPTPVKSVAGPAPGAPADGSAPATGGAPAAPGAAPAGSGAAPAAAAAPEAAEKK